MALTQQDVQAEVAAYQPPDPQAAPHPMAGPATAPPDPIQAAMTPPPAGKPTPSFLDSVISTVDKYSSKLGQAVMNDPTVRLVRQSQAGFVKGVVNTVDSVASAAKASGAGLAAAEDPAHAEEALNGPDVFHPAYDNARKVAMDFRDAIAVKDPSIPEHLAEGAGQLMPSFLMFSRVLGSIGTAAELTGGAKKAVDLARFATADAATNATAIAPHDPRLADTFALHKDAEGKYVDLLNKVSPDGSLFHQYINYIGDHTNETEAEGRWKNVLDGWNTAAALGGVLHVGGGILKQGWNALHFMADQGMGSMGDLMPKPQTGALGDNVPANPRLDTGSTATLKPEDKVVSKVSGDQIPDAGLSLDKNEYNKSRISEGSLLDHKPTPLDEDHALDFANTHIKTQTAAGREGSLHDMVTALSQHMQGGTPETDFYKDIFGRLSAKNLDYRIVPPGTGMHLSEEAASKGTVGSHNAVEQTIALYRTAHTSNTVFAHTLAHEAVHAATVSALEKQPGVTAAVSDLMNEAVTAPSLLNKPDRYGFKDPKEFIAEAEANPRFQQFLKSTKGSDGKSLWDGYKAVIGGIFGITGAALANPLFDKLLTKENGSAS